MKKKLKLIIPIVLLLGIIVYFYSPLRPKLSPGTSDQLTSKSDDPVTRFVTITKQGVEAITINSRAQPKQFSLVVNGGETPFIIHYNGGATNGGWDVPIPSSADREKPEWKKKRKINEKELTTIGFSLPPGAPDVRISYTIAPTGK